MAKITDGSLLPLIILDHMRISTGYHIERTFRSHCQHCILTIKINQISSAFHFLWFWLFPSFILLPSQDQPLCASLPLLLTLYSLSSTGEVVMAFSPLHTTWDFSWNFSLWTLYLLMLMHCLNFFYLLFQENGFAAASVLGYCQVLEEGCFSLLFLSPALCELLAENRQL